MKLACTVAGHRPGEEAIYNCGYYFSACRRCASPLIRTPRGAWGEPPAGHRGVWKGGRHSHSLEADYEGVLPVVQEQASLPALRSPFVSWSRSLVQLRTPGGDRRSRAAVMDEESGEYRYPGLLLVAVVIGAGLRMLMNFASAR